MWAGIVSAAGNNLGSSEAELMTIHKYRGSNTARF